jgi:hypothetical protein
MKIETRLEALGDRLERSAAADLRTAGTVAKRVRWPRSRLLAGSTVGAAGIAAALVLALGGSSASPAFAVTRNSDGSLLVHLTYTTGGNMPPVNTQLAGTGEQVIWHDSTGPATVSGAVTCTMATGIAAPPGPPVKVLMGQDGTLVISPGESGGNTAEGTWHTDRCVVTNDTYSGPITKAGVPSPTAGRY